MKRHLFMLGLLFAVPSFAGTTTATQGASQGAPPAQEQAKHEQARTILETERRSHGPGHGGRGGPPRGE